MKISIITTTYNVDKYIEDTLESVLSQKGDFYIEYILYDACSTDRTFEIIQKFQQRVYNGEFNGRCLGIEMQVYQEKDNGMYDGISKGFMKATGDVVAYINGDDFYLPFAFSTVCDVFKNNQNVNWIKGISNIYNEKGQNIIHDDYYYCYPRLILNGLTGTKYPFIQQESVFWRRELLDVINYDEFKNFNLAGDFYLWHTFTKNGNILYNVDSVLSGFRCRKNQKSQLINDYHKEMKQIVDIYYKDKKSIDKQFKFSIVPNSIIYNGDTNNWIIEKYSFKDILVRFKKSKFRKLVKSILLNEKLDKYAEV